MANDIYSKGSIINDEQFAPFNRYIDVNGLRMFVLDKVKDEFVLDVANTFEAMFPQSSDTIDLTSQQLLLQTMKDFNTFQRIGYIGPPENGEPASAPLSGGWEFAQDYIWEKPSSSTASQIGEVVEHLLHTITSISLKYTFPEKWDWDDTSSDVYLAMQEAIDKGIYNVSSYSSLKSDPEGYNTIIVQEFVYWFVSAEWNYFEVMGLSVNGSWEGGSNEEWSLLTSQEVEEQLPLAHKLYVESFSKLVQKPDGTKVTEWFSTDSSVAESTEDDTTSNTITLDESVYLREGTFLGNNYTIKMLGDNEEEIYAKGTGNAFVVGRDVFSEEQVKGILDNYEYVIKSISKTLTWKGTLDFVVVVQGDTGHPTGLLPSIAYQHGEDLTGDAGVLLGTNMDRVHVATYEQLTGIDLNGDEPDLGFYINVTENNEFKNFDVDVWIDPDPNQTSYSNLPEGQHDLISIITHEIAHSMGLAGTLDPYWSVNHYSKSLTEKDGQYYYSSERITNLIGKDLYTEYEAGRSDDDSLDHHVLDPEGGISGIASLMSGEMYSQRWSEPGPIEYAILYDSGWTERTTGKLSESIDSSENILSAHTDDVLSGTLNFNKGDNIIILDGQAKTYRGLEGDDTYFVSQLLPKDSKISITDTEGSNLIQLPANTYVDKSLFTKNAARLTLEDGREITISGADKFSYNIGGNITNADKGIDISFSEFAEIFGVYDILNSSGAQNGTISDLYII
ncbi:MAG: hypothetical protein ACJ0A2_03105 [Alphaproteobacteria bacterium]